MSESWGLERMAKDIEAIAEDSRDTRERVIRIEESLKPQAVDLADVKKRVAELEKNEAGTKGAIRPIVTLVLMVLGPLIVAAIAVYR